MIQWIRMRGGRRQPEEAYRFLARMRILSAALPAGFLIWTPGADRSRGPVASRADLAPRLHGLHRRRLLSRHLPACVALAMLIAGLPLAMRLLASGEPLLVCIGINLGLLLVCSSA
jgi:hypothetical protein